jgi:hypothetical protein
MLTMAIASSLLMLTSVLLMWRMRPSSVKRRFKRQAKKRRASRHGTTPDSTPLANLQVQAVAAEQLVYSLVLSHKERG